MAFLKGLELLPHSAGKLLYYECLLISCLPYISGLCLLKSRSTSFSDDEIFAVSFDGIHLCRPFLL